LTFLLAFANKKVKKGVGVHGKAALTIKYKDRKKRRNEKPSSRVISHSTVFFPGQ